MGRGGAAAADQPLEPMDMNEDEPSPLHTKNFVDFVRARKEPFANIEVEARATAIACIGNVAYWTGRKLTWDDAPGSSRATRKPTSTCSASIASPGTW